MTPSEAYTKIFEREPYRAVGRCAEDSRRRHTVRVDDSGLITATVDGIAYHGTEISTVRRIAQRAITEGIKAPKPAPEREPPITSRVVKLTLTSDVRRAVKDLQTHHGLDEETDAISLALAAGITRLLHLRPDTLQRLTDAAPELSTDDALDAATDLGIEAIVAHYARAVSVASAMGISVAEVWAQAVDLGLDALEQATP
jgi:hypothetical protein